MTGGKPRGSSEVEKPGGDWEWRGGKASFKTGEGALQVNSRFYITNKLQCDSFQHVRSQPEGAGPARPSQREQSEERDSDAH